jgi:hypothetical protein
LWWPPLIQQKCFCFCPGNHFSFLKNKCFKPILKINIEIKNNIKFQSAKNLEKLKLLNKLKPNFEKEMFLLTNENEKFLFVSNVSDFKGFVSYRFCGVHRYSKFNE